MIILPHKNEVEMVLYRFAFKMDDPAFGRVPRAAARSRRRRAQEYVEESDSEASCKDAATTKVYA